MHKLMPIIRFQGGQSTSILHGLHTHPSPQLRTDQGQANSFLLHHAVLSSALPTCTGSVGSLSSARVVVFAFNPTTITSLV
jgi:hypothetical protein